ncbi:hypothetical protein SAMN05443667_1229 [Flavobacterium gillisiae]|uniref:Uncharacterized protein n=1 Tax=Flavobacterium gillisiae TaxID=150146 RepID=A0A1H4GCP2_9FLAO|nr:hypothetical protein SAMN05443667_1229 [Flavobacterium gillisiae]
MYNIIHLLDLEELIWIEAHINALIKWVNKPTRYENKN